MPGTAGFWKCSGERTDVTAEELGGSGKGKEGVVPTGGGQLRGIRAIWRSWRLYKELLSAVKNNVERGWGDSLDELPRGGPWEKVTFEQRPKGLNWLVRQEEVREALRRKPGVPVWGPSLHLAPGPC